MRTSLLRGRIMLTCGRGVGAASGRNEADWLQETRMTRGSYFAGFQVMANPLYCELGMARYCWIHSAAPVMDLPCHSPASWE